MKVKTNVGIGKNQAGSIVELPDQEAMQLIKHGYAEDASEPSEPAPLQCDECDFQTTSLAGLGSHSRAKHSEANTDEESPEEGNEVTNVTNQEDTA